MSRTMSRFGRLALPQVAVAAGLLLQAGTARATDPTTADCLNANNNSVQLRNDGKLRAARAQLLICATQSCPADVRKECIRRVDEVNAQIPTVTFEPKDAAGRDLSAVKVTMDGEPLTDRLEGTALSIDPGVHTFVFETEGQVPVQKQLVLREGIKDRREEVAFGTQRPTVAVRSSRTSPVVPPTPPPAPEGSGLGTQKIAALVAGGVGVVGLGVGGAFGLVAMSSKNDAQGVCPTNQCATEEGVDKWNHARSAAQLADVFLIVGGVGLAGAAVLWFTAKSPGSETSAQVGLGLGGVHVRGTW
jgi:hypothetical protein